MLIKLAVSLWGTVTDITRIMAIKWTANRFAHMALQPVLQVAVLGAAFGYIG